MKRRTILKYAVLSSGVAIGAPLISVVLSGCEAEVKDPYQPQFFSEDAFRQLKQLLDTMLPKTDSPSATDVGVDEIFDQMAANVYSKEEQDKFRQRWSAIEAFLQKQNFSELGVEKQLEEISSLEKSSAAGLKDQREAFNQLKQQAVIFYLSTEEVGTQHLNYLPVPGEYKPCITLAETGGKKWAL